MPTTGASGDELSCLGALRWNGAPIEAERLVLRLLRPEDEAAVRELASDPEVAATLASLWGAPPDKVAEAWLKGSAHAWSTGTGFALAVVRREDDRLIGSVSLTLEDAERRGGEIGYWIGRPFWNQGYASEALERCLSFAFRTLGLRRLRARVMQDNAPSIRVLENAGFQYEGNDHHHITSIGRIERVSIYGLGKADHQARHPLRLVLVVCAALVDVDGRVLLTRRPPGKPMAGLWEFPGGKVHEGETPEEALIRELREELAIDVTESCLAPYTFASHAYRDFHLLMPLYVIRSWRGRVSPQEGQEIAWVRPNRMADYPMPPADVPLVALLRDLL